MAALTNEQIIEAIGEKTILELSELIKAMEEKFGVTAAAPVAVVAGGAAAGGAAEEEKTEFTVTLKGLTDPGKKIAVIKDLKEDVSKEEAAKIKEAITAAGGEVEIA